MGMPVPTPTTATASTSGDAEASSAAGISAHAPSTHDLSSIRTLIVDNYDSYTFNLFQYCTIDAARPPVVVRNDQFEWADFRDNIMPYFDAIVISPGPGRPDRAEDFGLCEHLLKHADIPIFGVCLGHQGLAAVNGGRVVTADPPMHGRLSDVHHDSRDLFAGLPNPLSAVRYHSLIVARDDMPNVLEETAWSHGTDSTKPKIIMGMKHKSRPIWSVQFHPESICTEEGQKMVHNFVSLASAYWDNHPERQQTRRTGRLPPHIASMTVLPSALTSKASGTLGLSALVFPIRDLFVPAKAAFEHLYGKRDDTFWLDSAKVEAGLSRYSYMGDASGPLSFNVKYLLTTRKIVQRMPSGITTETTLSHQDTFFGWLAAHMKSASVSRDRIRVLQQDLHANGSINTNTAFDANGHVSDSDGAHSSSSGSGSPVPDSDAGLAFPFFGGLVGYFGYEMKSESLRLHTLAHDDLNRFKTESAGTVPDAAFLFVDRALVYDHHEQSMYLVAVVKDSDTDNCQAQRSWADSMLSQLAQLARSSASKTNGVTSAVNTAPSTPTISAKSGWMTLAHDRDRYIANIQTSLDKINQGETYEVCLTTQLSRCLGHNHRHPLDMYQHLRKRNPAPYGAYLAFGDKLFMASSSPERFLRLDDDGWLSMKPIKGTLSRATPQNFPGTDQERAQEDERRRTALASSEKDRAENLMIVDLIRNDLNQISEAQSVHVPHLMVVESYATVHQLVTTVKGKLRSDLTAVDAAMRTFPPGSMTGAPKLRTVRILEEMEQIPRGPYSGVLGFFSVTGPADLSVVIRTAVFGSTPGESVAWTGLYVICMRARSDGRWTQNVARR
ncbi:ADC synthase [Entophlyctis helioformis]|nr:ADC synthase [Entophlyctis helioformis]